MLLLTAIFVVVLVAALCAPLAWRSATGNGLEHEMRRYRDVGDLSARRVRRTDTARRAAA